MELTLRQNLLTYIAYCLQSREFSYEKTLADFENAGIETTIKSLRKEFSLAKKEGLIEFKTHYRNPYPILSSEGKLEIKTRLPHKRYSDFEGSWKIVIFDLPESRRNDRLTLQRTLENMGFGRLTRACYISPHGSFSPIKRVARNLGIEENISYFKTREIDDEKRVIFRAWDLEKINEAYRKFISDARYATFAKKPLWPLKAKRLEQIFIQIYELDPQLPQEFLLPDWKGEEAYLIFKALANSY